MKILNKNAVLKDKKIVKIYHTKTLTDCKATSLMLKTYAELIDKGFNIENSLSLYNNSESIWAEYNNEVIGGICYNKQVSGIHQIWILLNFTEEKWRNLGVNTVCFRELEKIAKELGFNYISSFVHVDNIPSFESSKKLGMVANFYRMSKKIN